MDDSDTRGPQADREADRSPPGPDRGSGRAGPGQRLVRLAVPFYLGMAVLALLWRGLVAQEPLFFLSEQSARRGVRWGPDLALGAAAALLVIWLSHEFTRRTRAGAELARALAQAVGPLRPREIALLALLSGCAEEALFRGAIQPHLGLLATSLLFGAAHFVPRRELALWAAFSVAAGLLLGGLFEVTGNLAAPIAAHALVNGVNLGRLVREGGR